MCCFEKVSILQPQHCQLCLIFFKNQNNWQTRPALKSFCCIAYNIYVSMLISRSSASQLRFVLTFVLYLNELAELPTFQKSGHLLFFFFFAKLVCISNSRNERLQVISTGHAQHLMEDEGFYVFICPYDQQMSVTRSVFLYRQV